MRYFTNGAADKNSLSRFVSFLGSYRSGKFPIAARFDRISQNFRTRARPPNNLRSSSRRISSSLFFHRDERSVTEVCLVPRSVSISVAVSSSLAERSHGLEELLVFRRGKLQSTILVPRTKRFAESDKRPANNARRKSCPSEYIDALDGAG